MQATITIDDDFINDQIEAARISYWATGLDGSSYVWEIEDGADHGTRHKLDWQRAIQLAITHHPRILDPKNMDANTGDIWIQLAAFGEVRYG